jgi:hypothetical protein
LQFRQAAVPQLVLALSETAPAEAAQREAERPKVAPHCLRFLTSYPRRTCLHRHGGCKHPCLLLWK